MQNMCTSSDSVLLQVLTISCVGYCKECGMLFIKLDHASFHANINKELI